ncbi:hypothetical protein VOLCADRAFT_105847 [Volvox carteri f. nagariensis]|uniref:Uncharacterized protein n=1 Tax=Volvox carteri f. nagariensis TaxID=3068 RepID=D8U3K6_VOLCA|nr:uncharacterized protein VOLCADRAFT_105847 [Volvox carteri f. nagariensis]EFJ45624.1 hypothetical protein VOLCADRAFT_105847 [Volvox carteri f. nagariensis]|eukprot:XP_002953314.1 hypothetical protein VOLCADRAFT_105847 [Volvox carteri f. nagariensis]
MSSTCVLPTASTASGAKARTVPSICAPVSFKHYRRSTTNKAPRKRTFLVTMTRYNADLRVQTGAYSHNVSMLSCGVCRENYGDWTPYGDNGNGNNGNNNGSNNNNKKNWGPGDFGSDDSFRLILQLFGKVMLGALALIAAVAAFPASSSATSASSSSPPSSVSPRGTRLDADGQRLGGDVKASWSTSPSSSSSSSYQPLPRSKVMHVACKGSTLVVPLSDPQAAERLPGGWQRAKIVEAPIELSGREVAIINRRQYCVRESMRV